MWSPSPSGTFALSCDSSVSNSGDEVECGGGLFRNPSWDLLFAFTHKLDHFSILEADLWSIDHGVCIAWGREYQNFVVESNSFVVVELFTADTFDMHPLDQLIKRIKSIVTTQDKIKSYIELSFHIWALIPFVFTNNKKTVHLMRHLRSLKLETLKNCLYSTHTSN